MKPSRHRVLFVKLVGLTLVTTMALGAYLGMRSVQALNALDRYNSHVAEAQQALRLGRPELASTRLAAARRQAAIAVRVTTDPAWTLVTSLPGPGGNAFRVMKELSQSAPDVSGLIRLPPARGDQAALRDVDLRIGALPRDYVPHRVQQARLDFQDGLSEWERFVEGGR